MNITDYTIDGKCSGCGECCSNMLPMSTDEVRQIKAYIKKHNIKEQRHNFLQGIDMTCPFRDELNRKSLVYEVRPAICREFVCNHTVEDIQKAKIDLHKINRVVLMRNEFFGSNEDIEFLKVVAALG